MLVYVLNKDGNPLMPCKSRKARILLRENKAKIVNRNPFTIQLLYGSSGYKQSITLGIDLGYKFVGFAVVSNNKILEKGIIELRTDIPKLLIQRRGYRRNRRGRKTRYRECRFLNRVKSKKKGWLPPSVQNRYNHIFNWIDRFTKYLSDYSIKVEIANFDIAKIKNPDIEGIDYQRGNLYGYDNMRAYLIARENGKCQLCGKEKDNNNWQVHHIIQRKDGGSDKSNNLALLHSKCHERLHRKNVKHKLKKNKQYKDATFMNAIRWKLINELKVKYGNKVSFTYGYTTHRRRLELGLSKEHYNDAIAITNEDINENSIKPLYIKQVRKKKRSLHEASSRKGRKEPNRTQKRNRKNTKQIITKYGKFCLCDTVKVGNKTGYITGFAGKQLYVKDINEKYLKMDGKSYVQISVSKVIFIKRNNNFINRKFKELGDE